MIDIYSLVEIKLLYADDFLMVKETLTRIGVASKKDKVLYQSCHILHKQKRYFITHFKEMFGLDGKPANISEQDIGRRNAICKLLQEWDLIEVVNPKVIETPIVPLSDIKIIPYAEKKEWSLVPKYSIGKKKKAGV